MSILDQDQATKTPAQRTADQLVQGAKASYLQLLMAVKRMDQMMWNPRGVTAEDINAALGTNAAEVFRLRSLAASMLNAAKPNSVPSDPPRKVTIKDDGTTIIAPAPASPAAQPRPKKTV